MNSPKDKCPKCGSMVMYAEPGLVIFDCGSHLLDDDDGFFKESLGCKDEQLHALRSSVEQLREALTEIKREADSALNEKPGKESGACQWISLAAQTALAETKDL